MELLRGLRKAPTVLALCLSALEELCSLLDKKIPLAEAESLSTGLVVFAEDANLNSALDLVLVDKEEGPKAVSPAAFPYVLGGSLSAALAFKTNVKGYSYSERSAEELSNVQVLKEIMLFAHSDLENLMVIYIHPKPLAESLYLDFDYVQAFYFSKNLDNANQTLKIKEIESCDSSELNIFNFLSSHQYDKSHFSLYSKCFCLERGARP